MTYKDLEEYYLCGIGAYHGIERFLVGRYNKERETFSFPNGSYGATELGKQPMGGNATRVISAVPLQEIDDAELLYRYEDEENEVEEIPQMAGTLEALDKLKIR